MRDKLMILVAMGLSIGMIFLEQSGVGVTLNQMSADLHLTAVGAHWIMNAYLLVLATLLLGGGRLGDFIGAKRVFSVGMLVFILASLLAGFGHSAATLVIARGLQGLGASMLIPTTFSLIRREFDGPSVGKAIGIAVAFGSFFLAAGPSIGGAVTEFLNWRWIFLLNVPIGITCLLIASFRLNKDTRLDKEIKFDYVGLFSFTIALAALIIALMEIPVWGVVSIKTISLLIVSLVVASLFVRNEKKVRHPLFDLELIKNKAFLAGILILFLTQVINLSSIFWVLWMQESLHFSVFLSGMALLPMTFPVTFMSPLVGGWNDRYGYKINMRIGTIMLAFGLLWVGLSAYFENYWLMLPGIILNGFAIPMVINTGVVMVISKVPVHLSGMATGMYNTMRQVGGCMAFAVVGTLLITLTHGLQDWHVAHAATLAFCAIVLFTAVLGFGNVLLCFRYIKV